MGTRTEFGGVFHRAALACLCMLHPACDTVAQSHIDAHVPDEALFHRLLERDMKTYFGELHPGAVSRVEHEMLRDAPTQAGVSHPKFYLWVKAYAAAQLIDEGAVRAAAMNGDRFEVLAFLSKTEIVAKPERALRGFPAALQSRILQLAGVP